MNGLWDILSVAIGVSFVFMILSILNSWIQDYVAGIFNIRANNLADIMQVLLDPGALKLNGKKMALAQPPENNKFTISEKKKKPIKHEVEKYNETFLSLAGKYEVTTNDLQNLNPDVIEKLELPVGTELNIHQTFSKVQNGDTLSKIAKDYKVSIDNLRKANPNVIDTLVLPVGDMLTIPVKYTVKKDDKLSEIAKKNYDVAGEELKKANLDILNGLLKKANTATPTDESKQSDDKSSATPATQPKALGMLEEVAEKAKEVVSPLISNPTSTIPDDLTLPVGTELTIPVKHTVEAGDALSGIAQKYKVTIDTLQNEIPLQVGTEIAVPDILYKVKEVETLSKVVEKGYKVSVDELRKANKVINTLPLPFGDKLTIPDQDADRHKVVGVDETMNKIALARGVSYADLRRANPERSEGPDEHLEQGITLKIPTPEIGQMVSRRNVLTQLSANPVGSLYRHPIIHSLSKPGELPDRIPTKDFTVALLDLLDDIGRGDEGKKPTDKINIETIIKGIENLEKGGITNPENEASSDNAHPLAFRLRSLLYTAQINTQIKKATDNVDASLEEFQKAVSEWFDDTIARGSVWYKGKMQRLGILFGITLAVVLNADTIGISNALWHNAALRESISQAAETSAQQGQAPDSEQAQAQLDELISLGLPIGWSLDGNPDNPRAIPSTTEGWISKSIGLLLTGFAISQGSQLWFDLINRLIDIRSSVPKSDTEETAPKK